MSTTQSIAQGGLGQAGMRWALDLRLWEAGPVSEPPGPPAGGTSAGGKWLPMSS